MGGTEQERYRQVIGHFATGVAVITTVGPDGPAGLTANAVCSLSLHPLLLIVCVDNSARTLPLIGVSGRFAINVLDHAQHALSGAFASKRPEAEKFAGVAHTPHHQVPVLDDALAWLVCDLHAQLPGGDHTIVVGEVRHTHHRSGGTPLVWYRGEYGKLTLEGRDEGELPN